MQLLSFRLFALLFAASLLVTSCDDDDDVPEPANEPEEITTITLTLSPAGGGSDIVVSWKDLDGDGGTAPTIDDLVLFEDETYTYTLTFLNENESPAGDVTEEIEEEGEEHQIFIVPDPASESDYTGGTELGPEIAYTDTDENGCYVGLTGTISFSSSGEGELRIVLKHQPGASGKASVNCTTNPEGNPNLGGTDADITFPLTVDTIIILPVGAN